MKLLEEVLRFDRLAIVRAAWDADEVYAVVVLREPEEVIDVRDGRFGRYRSDGRSLVTQNRVYPTLKRAIIGGIAVEALGTGNTDAPQLIATMLGLPEE